MKQRLVDFLNVFAALNKSLVMLLLLIVGIVFRVTNFINGTEWTDLMRAVTVSYFGVTGIAHFTSMIQQHLDSKNAAISQPGASDATSVEVTNGS